MKDSTTTPSPPDLLDRCHAPLVRDLAWILLAPDLLDMPWPGRPTRGELGLADDATLADWLDAQEVNPEALARRIGETLRGRMGLYHECLWQFLLETAPATRLLAHNLRVHRDKVTLGELDLLYRYREDPTPVHLEVALACKRAQPGLLPEGPGDGHGSVGCRDGERLKQRVAAVRPRRRGLSSRLHEHDRAQSLTLEREGIAEPFPRRRR